ncbi:hypothetical protein FB45DRAFT_881030 [Roridomyces roridus]|uniref:Chromo domain-containing protein n=1 Tax=Roridomyces roridus TaxID=1738132 RepID=A0AAD7F8X3_9AGAR|nr:hypothetical protein FB45DRAFT_881030 [Roridomyces roridus]
MEPLGPPVAAQLEAILHQLQSLNIQAIDSSYSQTLRTFVDATNSQLEALKIGESSRQRDVPERNFEQALPDTPNSCSAGHNFSSGHSADLSTPTAQSRDSAPYRYPFIQVEHDPVEVQNRVYHRPNQPRQYGISEDDTLPMKPPLSSFIWPAQSLSKQPKPNGDVILYPAVAAEPPAGHYPHTPPYILNDVLDPSYRRGWRYAAPYNHSSKDDEKERMRSIQIPPNTTPSFFDKASQRFICEPIPGMVHMPLGIPMVHQVNGDPDMAVTVACAHSLKTLEGYDESKEILELVPQLMELTWGVEATPDAPGVPAIFELPGLQVNLRSHQLPPDRLKNGEGSFNLASTHGEGEGVGHFGPAVQTNAPAEAEHISRVLKILHRLYQLIMPLCISRFEWEMIKFAGLENNVVAFGGLDPGPTSCQLNSSAAANVYNFDFCGSDIPSVSLSDGASSEREWINLTERIHSAVLEVRALIDAIGPQGRPHGDFQDDPLPLTLFVLLLRLPKGSDMGPFMFLRPALYLRETDEHIIFASFKANDIHSGTAPTYVKQLKDRMVSVDSARELFKKFGPHVRCGYVMYPSITATTRSAQILYTKSLRFLYTPADSRAEKRKYYASHGQAILGDHRSRFNRFGREGVLGFNIKSFFIEKYLAQVVGGDNTNFLIQCGLSSTLNTDDLLASLTYTDEAGLTRTLEPAPFDIDNDSDYAMMSLYRAFYTHWREVLGLYSLGLTHSTFTAQQTKITKYLAGITQRASGIPKERNLVVVRSVPARDGAPLIERVLGHRKQGSDMIWSVLLVGSNEIRNVSEATWWLKQGENAVKCLKYYSETNAEIPVNRRTPAHPAPETTSHSAAGNVVKDLHSSDQLRPQGGLQNDRKRKRRATPEFSDSEEDEENTARTAAAVPGTTATTDAPDTAIARSGDSENGTETVPGAVMNDAPGTSATRAGGLENAIEAVPGATTTDPPGISETRAGGLENSIETVPEATMTDAPGIIEMVPEAAATNAPGIFSTSAGGADSQDSDGGNAHGKKRQRTRFRQDGEEDRDIADPQEKGQEAPARSSSEDEPQFDVEQILDTRIQGDQPNSEDEPQFDVEQILDTRIQGGQRQWLVKWEGYLSSENSWHGAEAFGYPAPMLDSFNRERGLLEDKDILMESRSPASSDDERTTRPRKSKGRRGPPLADKTPEEEDMAPEIDLDSLKSLLDLPKLESEYKRMVHLQATLAKPKQMASINVTPRDSATRILSHIEEQNDLSFRLQFALGSGQRWNPHLARLTMECISNIGTSIAGLVLHSEVGDLVQRGAQAQICRCLVAAYQWLVQLGPSLATQLVETLVTEGEIILKDQFPELAPMVINPYS